MRKILIIIILSVIGLIYLNYTERKELLNDMMNTLTPSYPAYDNEPSPVQTGETETENGLNHPFQPDNPNNLPILTETETAEGLYWDPVWKHETYLEIAPDSRVWLDEAGNKYSYPVDASGNPLSD
ncbi:MAG: hypothetical protein IKB01_02230 [Lachnospiraceae bacterium]|nr:hypothetical protein [Lachnospiraceae bacterium]